MFKVGDVVRYRGRKVVVLAVQGRRYVVVNRKGKQVAVPDAYVFQA